MMLPPSYFATGTRMRLPQVQFTCVEKLDFAALQVVAGANYLKLPAATRFSNSGERLSIFTCRTTLGPVRLLDCRANIGEDFRQSGGRLA